MDADTLRELVLKCIAAEYPAELWRGRLNREIGKTATDDETLRALNYLRDRGSIEWRMDGGTYVYRLTPAGWRSSYGANPDVTDLAGAIVDVLCLEYPHHVAEQTLLGALLEKRGMSGVSTGDYEAAIGYLVQCGYAAARDAVAAAGERVIDRRREYKLTALGIDLAEEKISDAGVTQA
ncbi:hypothetical protein [Zavarzinia sp.]|uniref:hypothetical protein n=1 Tax=Zavarzinia sp. TaxID=2027920 RepID=UPI00356B532A